jgi:hypothetical protein
MYRSKILNRIKLYYFLKFVTHEFNCEIVKSRMVILSEREKYDVDSLLTGCYNLRVLMSKKK